MDRLRIYRYSVNTDCQRGFTVLICLSEQTLKLISKQQKQNKTFHLNESFMPANPSKSSCWGRKIWIFKSFVLSVNFVLYGLILLLYIGGRPDQSEPVSPGLRSGMEGRNASWVLQRYNAGMGRYQSTHWLYRPGPGGTCRDASSFFSLSSSCQLVER